MLIMKWGIFVDPDQLNETEILAHKTLIQTLFPSVQNIDFLVVSETDQVFLNHIPLKIIKTSHKVTGRKAAQQALNYLQHHHFDFVSVYRSNQKKTWQFWLGSFTEYLVHLSSVSVLIIPNQEYTLNRPIRSLIAFDPQEENLSLLDQFFIWSQNYYWIPFVISVLEPWFFNLQADSKTLKDQKELETRINNIKNKIKKDFPQGEYILKNGFSTIVSAILEEIETRKIQLLVTSHKTQGIEKILLGSIAHQLIQRSQCPILVIKEIKTLR